MTSKYRAGSVGLLYFRTKDFLICDNKVDTVRKTKQTSLIHHVSGPYDGMPKKVIGMYILLADDTEPG